MKARHRRGAAAGARLSSFAFLGGWALASLGFPICRSDATTAAMRARIKSFVQRLSAP